ncbi:MAG: hypothetical protein ABIR32_11160 [Ilumatobacteraceae bacterium]
MDTAAATRPAHSTQRVLRVALAVGAFLWFLVGIAAVSGTLYSDDDWETPYALFSVLLLMAAATTTLAITMYTSEPHARSASPTAASVLAAAFLAVIARRTAGTPIASRSATLPA